MWLQGNRDHIDGMAAGSQKVLQDVLRLIDTYDLYGGFLSPHIHSTSQIVIVETWVGKVQ